MIPHLQVLTDTSAMYSPAHTYTQTARRCLVPITVHVVGCHGTQNIFPHQECNIIRCHRNSYYITLRVIQRDNELYCIASWCISVIYHIPAGLRRFMTVLKAFNPFPDLLKDWLTSPMRGKVLVLIVCVCVCLCMPVTTLAGTTSPLKAKVRYQQKALKKIGKKLTLELN